MRARLPTSGRAGNSDPVHRLGEHVGHLALERRGDVAVDICRGAVVGVAWPLLNNLQVRAGPEQPRGVDVAEIVQARMWDAGSSSQAAEAAG